MIHQLTCSCKRIIPVRDSRASCPSCKLVFTTAATIREMTAAEQAVAAAQLRGERLPVEEPTITTVERLR